MALTRAEDTLLLSGHHWGASEGKPRGPSEFLCELKEIIDGSADDGEPCGVVEHWAPAPADGEPNPLRDKVDRGGMACRPGGGRAAVDVDRGAAPGATRDDGSGSTRRPTTSTTGPPTSTRCSPSGTGSRRSGPPRCPPQLSVSSLVELGPRSRRRAAPAAPQAARPPRSARLAGHRISRLGAAVLRSRAAVRPRRSARRGRRSSWRARTRRASPNCRPRSWRRRGRRAPRSTSRCPSTWSSAARWCGAASTRCSPTPTAATVVDWKTGDPPDTPEAKRHAAVQLAVYRLAWAALRGVPAESGPRGVPLRAVGADRRSRDRCRTPTTWRRCCELPAA